MTMTTTDHDAAVQRYIVIARTIDGTMYYNREYDTMTSDRHEATPLSALAADAVVKSLIAHRTSCATGEQWDNSYHNVTTRRV